MATSIYLGNPPENIKKWIIDNYVEPEVDMLKVPLTFTAKEPNSTVRFNIAVDYDDNYCGEYVTSFDGQTWNDYTSNTEIKLLNINDKVMFRAKTQNENCYGGYNNAQFNLKGKIEASGNIQFLLDSTGERTDVPMQCFSSLFSGDLLTPPKLPATTLTDYCYNSMFSGCKSLTQAPELPAMSLTRECYAYMFAYCTSLTQAPELPATTLANACYSGMFDNCTNIPEPKYKMPNLTFDEVANEIQNKSIFIGDGQTQEVQCSDKILVAALDIDTNKWIISEK